MLESLVKHHYDAVAAGHLVAHRCADCGTLTYPITTCCESCGSWEYEEVELSGRGTLLFASHNLGLACNPRFQQFAPYVFGHIVLEEGVVCDAFIKGVAGTPEAVEALYERGPVPVVFDPLDTGDLMVTAFSIAS